MKQPCGCCEGINKLTPSSVANRPGLHSLIYRIGTHAGFLETMKAQLSALGETAQVLSGLTTRAGNDPSIALLDAWAMVADVLTFYQERIVNEGYLMTATERRSIAELARLVGYELRPGVAASVYLAYKLEDGYEVTIPAGNQVQSIPAPGELPQTFETSEPFKAHYHWNLLKPRLTRPIALTPEMVATTLYFKGTSTNLKPNDPLLLVFNDKAEPEDFYRVLEVKPDPANERTEVKVEVWLKNKAPDAGPHNLQQAIDEVKNTIKRYLKLEDFGNPTGQMAGNIQALLNDMDSRMNLPSNILIDVLGQLKESHDTARLRSFTKLEPWLAGMIEEFEAVLKKLKAEEDNEESTSSIEQPEKIAAGEPALPQAASTGATATTVAAQPAVKLLKSAFDPSNLLFLANTIGFPPLSAPSATASGQGINISSTNLTTASRLLKVLQPELRTFLPEAWGSVRATEPSDLKVYAFGTRTSAFGHNAPLELKSVFNSDGVLKGVERKEWPLTKDQNDLAEPFSITVTLSGPPQQTALPPSGVPLPAPDLRTFLNVEISLSGQTMEVTKPLPAPPFSIVFPAEIQETVEVTSPDNPTDIDPRNLLFVFTKRRTTVRISQDPSGRSIINSSVDNPIEVIVHNAPIDEDTEIHVSAVATPRPDFSLTVISIIRNGTAPTETPNKVSLDSIHEQIVPGSWVVIERVSNKNDKFLEIRIRKVEQVRESSRADYGISAKGTELTLNGDWLELKVDKTLVVIRRTVIFAQSEELELAERPVEAPVCGDRIELDGVYDDLEAGQLIAIDGEREIEEGVKGVFASELVRIAAVEQYFDPDLPGDTIHTRLILSKKTSFCYKRDTVRIYGNVVKATHGETKTEVLGSGDGGRSMQRFTLQKSPLTYVSVPNARGIEGAIQVRVDDVLWHEAPGTANLKPTDRSYVISTSDDEKTTITFGNGERGSRLPTGFENVKAAYRIGLGKQGNVGKDQISMLLARPLGVQGVTNPVAATGGAEKEDRDEARRNAPMALMALDRLLSVQDYADFTRTFAGIGKAAAVSLTDGRRQLVHLTIAGADDIPIDVTSDLFRNLQLALHQFGDPHQAVKVELRELKLIVISAKVRVNSDYLWTLVEPKIRGVLLDTFSFNRRNLGQDVLLSEVISVIQSVEGVEYVDVDALDTIDEQRLKQTLASPGEIPDLTFELKARVVVNTAQAKPLNHVVKQGESIETVMQLYGISEERLRTLNPSLAGKAAIDPLPVNMMLIIRRIQPAQLALLTRDVRETLTLTELTR